MVREIETIIDRALREDIGPRDVTTNSLIEKEDQGCGRIRAKESFLLAGMEVFSQVFARLEKNVEVRPLFDDGDEIENDTIIAEMQGPLWALLSGERTALNFLQRLSGIATFARKLTEKVAAYPVRILDTRKTTPGWRALEKEAVRLGGAHNHRWGLYDGVLIKDNHIRAVGSITEAIARARSGVPLTSKIEVEVSSLEEVEEALEAKADIIMLDNMTAPDMRLAVAKIGGAALVEASGGITLENIAAIAETGVDFISVGALTTAVRAVDISMEVGGQEP
jgi:nicotinate-nucleotide pyrophosphorylase (carboxylating)